MQRPRRYGNLRPKAVSFEYHNVRQIFDGLPRCSGSIKSDTSNFSGAR